MPSVSAFEWAIGKWQECEEKLETTEKNKNDFYKYWQQEKEKNKALAEKVAELEAKLQEFELMKSGEKITLQTMQG